MYKMQLTKDYICTLNLLSLQQGTKETKESCNKYFNSIIRDTMKAIKKNEKSYLFNLEQINTIKSICRKEKIKYIITEIERGIWLVMKK